MNSVWATLSAIDCNEHVEKKGKFSYLAWTWAWAMVKERYPDSHYVIADDITYPDGTMEVRMRVTIEQLTHTMWLPVLNYNNQAIQNPNAFDINTARMRCLVKGLAMFGLGHYIFAGESIPAAPSFTEAQKDEFYGLIAQNDGFGLKHFHALVGQELMEALFNAAPQGQKTAVKDKCRKAVQGANNDLKAAVAAIEAVVGGPDGTESMKQDAINEIFAEMGDLEKEFVVNAMDEVLSRQVNELVEAA